MRIVPRKYEREEEMPSKLETEQPWRTWMFALDRTNYARWLPVHIRDMLAVPTKHPEIYREFLSGKFTAQKTLNAFSAIPMDQAHEQNNELIKGNGGAIGLTENPSALLRWMVSRPELARLVKEFEDGDEDKHAHLPHHEQSHASQTRFKNQVSTLVSVIEELSNRFEETSEDIVSLMSKDIADTSMCTTLRKIDTLGKEQYK